MSTPSGQQGPYGPGQDTGNWNDNQQGSYNAYPQGAGSHNSSGYNYYGPTRPMAYLDGAPVGFADATREAFRNIFTFQGRASRSAFWWFALTSAIIYAIISLLSDRSWVAGTVLDIVVGIPLFITNLSLAIRRLHDSGRTGWWWWIGLVPFVGWIVLLIFYLMPSTPGPNRFNI